MAGIPLLTIQTDKLFFPFSKNVIILSFDISTLQMHDGIT